MEGRIYFHPWVAFVIGALLFMATVNAVLLILALRVQQPLIEKNPYEQGLVFQQSIDEETQFRVWKLRETLTLTPATEGSSRIDLALIQGRGLPFSGAQVTLEFRYPANAAFDQTVSLHEDAPGLYTGVFNYNTGVWVVTGLVSRDSSLARFSERKELADTGAR